MYHMYVSVTSIRNILLKIKIVQNISIYIEQLSQINLNVSLLAMHEVQT